MDWLSQSSDLNLIKNIWHILNSAIDNHMGSIYLYKKLEEVVCREWKKINKEHIITCIEKRPKICTEDIKNRGDSIDH